MRDTTTGSMAVVSTLAACLALAGMAGPGAAVAEESAAAGWTYGANFFTSSSYDPGVPAPAAALGFEVGSRPVHHEELWRYLDALDRASDRVVIEEHREPTIEGRRLAHLVITAPGNHARMGAIRADLARLADPRATGGAGGAAGDARAVIERTPLVAWLGYSIHGDELSGVDAALALAYELAASEDPLTLGLLRDLVVVIDPMQNPDGRERFLTQTTQWRPAVPNPDYQAMHHAGYWPWGRGNHYLFDLNRDWFGLVHPESRGRVRTLLDWKPQLVVDAHEMSGLSSFLFSPPREPHNPNLTAYHRTWGDIFARDQAAAFDRNGWSYYTGEWNEEWYPGYGSGWAKYGGSIGILYEQAGVNGSIVRQADGSVLTYRESVHHQLVSSLANLATAAGHRRELLEGYRAERAAAIDAGRSGPVRAFYLVPGAAADRVSALARLLRDQGIEVSVLRRETRVSALHGIEGGATETRALPAGTCVVNLAQPMGVLARTLLEFDPRMETGFLESERRELEARGDTRIYETTAWSLPMMYGVEAWWSGAAPPGDLVPFDDVAPAAGRVENPGAAYGYLIDASSDASVRALAMLLGEDVRVRVARKPFRVEGRDYPRGTLLLRRRGNIEGLDSLVSAVAAATGVTAHGVSTAKSELRPDLGGGEFRLLESPRIAVLAGPPLNFYSFGTVWWLLDAELALRASALDVNQVAEVDLGKYNVVVMPSSWSGPDGYRRVLGERGTASLRAWIEGGGTLVTLGSASAFAADSTSGLSQVRERGAVLGELAVYRRAVEREIAARAPALDSLLLWEGMPPRTAAAAVSPPADATAASPAAASGDPKVLEEEDRRARLFRPQGTIVRVDLDREHWLTAGMPDAVPVLLDTQHAYMSMSPVETPGRFAPAAGLRMSGLLWPEARDRWGDTAYLTRESRGRGQLIMFAGEPHFRGQFKGSMRLLENALLLGPGLGTPTTPPW